MDSNVPPSITRFGLLSIPWIINCIRVSYILGYNELMFILMSLTITSIKYWTNMRPGIVKNIDVTLALTTLGMKSYIAHRDFLTLYKLVWFISLLISSLAYYMNQVYFNISVTKDVLHDRIMYITWFIPVKYTYPNTIERDAVYTRSVLIHMIFIHILPTTAFSVCAMRTVY
jgi:hypothetical protein